MLLDFMYFLSSAESDSFLLLNFLQFLSSEESDLIDDEPDNDGSDLGSAVTCAFNFRFDDSIGRVDVSVGRVCGVGYGVFFLIGISSTCDIFPLVVFVPTGFESKGGQLIEIFWCPKS